MDNRCLLCNSTEVEVLDKINHLDVIYLYRDYLNCNTSNILQEDISYVACRNCDVRFYLPIFTGDESFYNCLQNHEWYYTDQKEEYRIAKEYISRSDNVLEVGSGKGAFAKHLASDKYIGLDFSKNAKEMAATNGIRIENESIQDFAEKYPAQFDVVASFQVLEHVADPHGFIQAKVKALKTGGKMIIAVPSEDSFLRFATNVVLNMPPHHQTRWTDRSLRFVAEANSLELLRIRHETIQENQKVWILSTMLQSCILKNKIVDLSIGRKALSKLTDILALGLSKRLENVFYPSGYSAVAVYRKK